MLLTLRGCSQRRKKESKRGVYLEKSRIKLKKVSKTIRTEEVVCVCVQWQPVFVQWLGG